MGFKLFEASLQFSQLDSYVSWDNIVTFVVVTKTPEYHWLKTTKVCFLFMLLVCHGSSEEGVLPYYHSHSGAQAKELCLCLHDCKNGEKGSWQRMRWPFRKWSVILLLIGYEQAMWSLQTSKEERKFNLALSRKKIIWMFRKDQWPPYPSS